MRKLYLLLSFITSTLLIFGIHSGSAQSTAFSFQGQLGSAGSPANGLYDFQVKLFADGTGGSALGVASAFGVSVTNGVFNLAPDFGAMPFDGSDRWLEINVRSNGISDPFTTLSPRQVVTHLPYAIFAYTAASAGQLQSGGTAAIRGQPSGAAGYGPNLLGGAPANSIGANAGSSTVLGGLNFEPNFVNSLDSIIGGGFGNHIYDGADNGFIGAPVESTIGTNATYGFIGGGSLHLLEGDSGAIVGGRYGRIQFGAHFSFIGGGDGNWIQSNSYAGFIGGGNANTISNDVTAGFVGGGYYNRVGAGAGWSGIVGGAGNVISQNADHSFLGGGEENTINYAGTYSVIGGGHQNSVLLGARSGFIGGGEENTIGLNQYAATIGGGVLNTNLGYAATIPGGFNNTAAGQYSFASGTRARAMHNGSFVWSDTQNADFYTTNINEFAVRAGGGARFETAGAGLRVDGAKVLTGTVLAGDLADGSITGDKLAPGTISTTQIAAGAVTAGAIAPGAVDGGRIANGAVVRSVNGIQDNLTLAGGDGINLTTNGHTLTLASGGWQLNGNRAISNSFLGTVDNSPVDFRVGNQIAFRLLPGSNPLYAANPNVVGGAAGNFVADAVSGATIAGGGGNLILPQAIAASFGTVGGGYGNSILADSEASLVAGGFGNQVGTNSGYSAIGGGGGNSVRALLGTVGGGSANQIGPLGAHSFIGGGSRNLADATNATVLGGYYNQVSFGAIGGAIAGGVSNQIIASAEATIIGGLGNVIALGNNSTILGGVSNLVNAANAIAAGTQAHAIHDGAFVWADQNPVALESATNNEFLVRATGGTRFISALEVSSEYVTNSYTTYTTIEVPAGTPGAIEKYTCHDLADPNPFFCGFGPGGPDPVTGPPPSDPYVGIGIQTYRSTNYVLITATNINTHVYLTSGSPAAGVKLEPGAGSWSNLSDRNAKDNFSPVDVAAILEKIVALPITTWNYRSQPESIRHLGPVAQDFRAAFNLGSNDTTITSSDEDGVALAAIKGLNQKLEDQIKDRDTKIAGLEKRLQDLEKAMRRWAEQSEPSAPEASK